MSENLSDHFEGPVIEVRDFQDPDPGDIPSERGSQTSLQGPVFKTSNFMTIERLKESSKKLHIYTGLESYAKFLLVFNSLFSTSERVPPHIHSIAQNLITLQNKFLLFLIKLRTNLTHEIISDMFNISESSSLMIFQYVLQYAYTKWKQINIWPSKALVNYYMPKDFKDKFPSTRIILDATEIPILKPSNHLEQKATFSYYKNRNTLKVMVGMSPGGMITYISPAYGGSTSDRQIIARSDLFKRLEKGDAIMADRGINVEDLFAPYGITVNIPTFMKGINQLPTLVVKKDRRIAAKRVHVERIIGLGKTFKILNGPLKTNEIKFGSQIIFVCYFLCNFRRNIVRKH